MGVSIVRTLLLGAAGAVALAGFAASANAQTPCWSSTYGYYNCATPSTMYYGSSVPPVYYPPTSPTPYVAATPYAAWNAYDYRDYRQDPRWLPSYPGPRPGGH